MLAASSAAQPALDCEPSDAPSIRRYIYGRTTLRFCVPPSATEGDAGSTYHWEAHYAHRAEWEHLAYSASRELEVSVPLWTGIEVRARRCWLASDLCSDWSRQSDLVYVLPDLDLDGSGSISVADVMRVCRDGVNPLLNRRLDNGEYVSP